METFFKGLRIVGWSAFVVGLLTNEKWLVGPGTAIVLGLMVKVLFHRMRKAERGNTYTGAEQQ